MCRSAVALPRGISVASGLCVANHNIMTMKTQKERLKQQEESRDFFCVVSDAFRIFARRSSMVLGSAWAFAHRYSHYRHLGTNWPHVSLFGYVAAHY